MSIELKSTASISGWVLKIHESFLDSAVFNIQFDTLRLCKECYIHDDMIVFAIEATRKQWGVGYPGIPQLVVFDTIKNSPPTDSRLYFAAGVFLFSDWAISFDQDGKHAEAGRYFHEAEEMYALLRFDTGELLKYFKTELALKGAEARHSSPGGSREKAQRIREIWATGKYSSRDICAEQECAVLGMSFSTARKALRGTPTPNLECPSNSKEMR